MANQVEKVTVIGKSVLCKGEDYTYIAKLLNTNSVAVDTDSMMIFETGSFIGQEVKLSDYAKGKRLFIQVMESLAEC